MDGNSQQRYEERAVKDAKMLIAYTAKIGKSVDDETLKTLTIAGDKLGTDEWTPDFAVGFWKAFKRLSQLISPATVDSVKANWTEPRGPGFRGVLSDIIGRSPARRTSNFYTIITLVIIVVLLVVQVYWVVGNTLEVKLTELLNNEKELTADLNKFRQDFSDLELLYKTKEIETDNIQSIQRDYNYNFYSTPTWEREKLQIELEIQRLDGELESIRTQLERNRFILFNWSEPWKQILIPKVDISESGSDELTSKMEYINTQIASKTKENNRDPNASGAIGEKNRQLKELNSKLEELSKSEEPGLESIQDEFDKLSKELANPEDLRKQIITERNISLQELNDQYNSLARQLQRVKVKEDSQRVRLGAGFVLVILESYILPILYALLGASAHILRTVAKEIEEENFSIESKRGYILRLALGTLAGLMVGWFVFLLPSQTFLASISPLAIAFLVGYNIEILFSWMDAFIERFSKTDKSDSGIQNNSDSSTDQEPD